MHNEFPDVPCEIRSIVDVTRPSRTARYAPGNAVLTVGTPYSVTPPLRDRPDVEAQFRARNVKTLDRLVELAASHGWIVDPVGGNRPLDVLIRPMSEAERTQAYGGLFSTHPLPNAISLVPNAPTLSQKKAGVQDPYAGHVFDVEMSRVQHSGPSTGKPYQEHARIDKSDVPKVGDTVHLYTGGTQDSYNYIGTFEVTRVTNGCVYMTEIADDSPEQKRRDVGEETSSWLNDIETVIGDGENPLAWF